MEERLNCTKIASNGAEYLIDTDNIIELGGGRSGSTVDLINSATPRAVPSVLEWVEGHYPLHFSREIPTVQFNFY